MSDYLEVIVLGMIQGISEFLPISSDGHLAIGQALFAQFSGKPLADPLELTIVLHAGTLAAVVVVFWREIIRLFTQDRHIIGLIIVGTIPVVVTGLLMKLFLDDYLASPMLTGVMLIVTGMMLLWAGQQPRGTTTYQEISLKEATVIGLFQSLAPLPGLSRSGCTISAGLWQGLRPDAAATFSFLLSLPAVAGACLVEFAKMLKEGQSSTPAGHLIVGTIVSFLVGVFALRWLLAWLKAGRFQDFAWWCIPLGIGVIIWQLVAA